MDRKRTVDNSITTRSSFLAKNTGITGFSPHIGLYQSLKELLENAIDATTTSSSSSDALCTLKLSRTSSSGGFRITVSDTGDGIARDSISNVVTNIFCSTKGQSCQSSSSSSSSFGRYGIGIKAAILYAQEMGVITPLTVTTFQAIDDTVSSARYGIDRAKDAPLIVSLSYSSKDSACSHGTTVSLEVDNVNDQDSTSSFLFIQAYLERLVAFPMRKTALILELVNTKSKAPSRGTKRGLTGDTTSTDFSSLSSSIFQSIGGTAHTQSSFDIRDYLASHFNVPIECVSSSFDSKITTPDYSTSLITSSLSSSSSSLQVQVAIVLTPVIPSTPPTSTEAREQSLKTLVEDARAAGNESGVIHIVRYANSIPLLTTSAECALTLGATDSVQWGQRFGLSLTPLFSIEEITLDEGKKKKKKTTASTKNKASSSSSEGGGGGGGGGEAVMILPRKLLDSMNQHPAARVSAAFSADTSKLDAEGAYAARSCITDAVTVPFGSLRIFINVTGSSLLFGDLKKTHILDDMTKSRTLRSSFLVAEAMQVALTRLQGQLKQHVSIIQVADRIPTQLLESTRTANLRLLKNIYLPSIASNLIKILTQAGGASSNMWKNIVLSTSAAASAVAPSTTAATEVAGSQQRYLFLPESLRGTGNSLLQADGLISSSIEFEYEGLRQALLTRITRTLDACILAQDEAIVAAEIAEEEERAQEQLLEAFACHSAAHAHSLAIRKHEDDPFQHFVTAFASSGSGIGGQQVKERGNTEEQEEEEEVDNEEVSNASACADRAFETALLAIQTHQMRSGRISERKRAKLSQRQSEVESSSAAVIMPESTLIFDKTDDIQEEEEEEEEDDLWSWVPKQKI